VDNGPTVPPYRLTEIRDRFGNTVTVTPLSNPTRWQISDGHRTHVVHFQTSPTGRPIVDKVVLAAFSNSTATYDFDYATTTIHEHCGDLHSSTPTQRPVALLTSVSPPASADAGSYEISGASGYHTGCSEGGVTINDLPGALRQLELPTGGHLAWTYQKHSYPARGIFTPGEPSLEVTQTLGVKTRRVLDFSGACVGNCTWTYCPARHRLQGSAVQPEFA
jgi:hypothetical protein